MKLLLAEDEKALSKALVTILKHNNYTVDAVFDGEDALDYLLRGEYDGAILDVMMPKKDGISVLKELRKTNKSLPVLILTARTEVEDRVLGLDSGADDYLGKPFNIQELLARVRAMLRRSGGEADNVLSIADITLNRSTYELKSPSGCFRLSNKEYQIMELLVLNAGKIIPTEKLMEKIWGFDSEADQSVIWTYISYLRKKLTQLTNKVVVGAVRNVGYVLERKDV